LAWQGSGETRARAERLEALRLWALERGLLLEREDHPRLLALLDQPRLGLVLAGVQDRPLTAADLAGTLQQLALWQGVQAVSLLLAPDAQRVNHPSANLEPESRSIEELGGREQTTCPRLELQPGAFLVWS
ncbi:MAG: bifunctional 3,4-dihydroxy-2-butanone-4-phosphate synthase/GTP cyclohydrolase II, partial [Cyanobacteriota bacterium]